MSKIVKKDGKSFRKRRGELVEIPEKWVGQTTYKQTIRKRRSKQVGKRKKSDGWKNKPDPVQEKRSLPAMVADYTANMDRIEEKHHGIIDLDILNETEEP